MTRRALVASAMALTVAGLVGFTVKASIHTTATPQVPIPLAFSEGILLKQHAVPIKLPETVSFFNNREVVGIVAVDAAPKLSLGLLDLARYDAKSLGTVSSFPPSIKNPGFFAMITDGSASMAYQFPLVREKSTTANGFAFIGTPTKYVDLPPSSSQVRLSSQVMGSWYAGAQGANGYPSSYLLVWQKGPTTYAVWAQVPVGMALNSVSSTVLALARSTATAPVITHVERASLSGRYFNNVGSQGKNAGNLVQQTLSLAPIGTPGYRSKDGVDYKLQSQSMPVAVTAPPYYTSTPLHPFPGLQSVRGALDAVKTIPVRLPTITPYLSESVWPRLSYRVDAHGYFIDMRTSDAKVPPNTPYAVSPAGLAGWQGTIAGGNLVQLANYDYVSADGPTTAPTVSMAQFLQPSWVSGHDDQGVYRGWVILPDGVRALVLSALAGDGAHTFVEFHVNGVPYGVGDYHNINQAVEMAASMTVVPK